MSSTPSTLGQYQIIREIARSNDIVYEGYDPLMNRRVAVKELSMPPGFTPQQLEDRVNRFRREAQAVGSLNHPNIMTVFSFSEDSGRYFMAMEFLDGITLRKEIDNKGFLEVDRAIEIVCDILSGLAHAHDEGVVHRDIKPDNIQLTSTNGVKITDFGIARLTFQPNLTMDGQVFGTPSYMSPEQIVGKEIDARTDLFSVGVMLYEMLSGQKPFQGDHVIAITHAVVNSQPPKPSQIPDYLWSVISRSLEKAPQMRFHNAREMRQTILDAQSTSQSFSQTMPGNTYGYPQVLDPYSNPQYSNPYQTGQSGLGAAPNASPGGSYNPYGSPSGTQGMSPYGGVPPQSYHPQSYNPYGSVPPNPYAVQPPPPTFQNYNPYASGTPNQPGYQIPPGTYYPPPPGPPLLSPQAKQKIRQVTLAVFLVAALILVIVVAFISVVNSIQQSSIEGQAPNAVRVASRGAATQKGAIPEGRPKSAEDRQIEAPRTQESKLPAPSANQNLGPDPQELIRQATDASTSASQIRLLTEAGDAYQKRQDMNAAFATYRMAFDLLVQSDAPRSEIRKVLYKMEEVSPPGSSQREAIRAELER